MTIASEISRLQNDKAAICTAIENKGVTVGNVTLDSYATCIDAIEQGGDAPYLLKVALVGGGGGGGGAYYGGSGKKGFGGGGGGGGVYVGYLPITDGSKSLCVNIGAGGTGGTGGATGSAGGTGGNTNIVGLNGCLLNIPGGGGGGAGIGMGCACAGCMGASGGGASGGTCMAQRTILKGGSSYGFYSFVNVAGSHGGDILGYGCCGMTEIGGGGGGAKTEGKGNKCVDYVSYACTCKDLAPGAGGDGISISMGGCSLLFSPGGGGGNSSSLGGSSNIVYGKGGSGAGNGGNYYACIGTSGINKGSGGGGGGACGSANSSSYFGKGGNGAAGVAIIGYCTDKSVSGFTSATGGNSCWTSGGCKFHCFTSSGTFTIVS